MANTSTPEQTPNLAAAASVPAANRPFFLMEDFFPNRGFKSFKTGSELLLAYYMNKYTTKLLGKPIMLDAYSVNKRILKCNQMAFCRSNAFFRNVAIPFSSAVEECRWIKNLKRSDFYNGDSSYVEPVAQDNLSVTYSFINDAPSWREIRRARSTGYVDLIAYNIVNNYAHGVKRVTIIDNSSAKPDNDEYNELFILRDNGNKLLTPDVALFTYMTAINDQPEYRAFVAYNQQLGRMTRQYTPKEKYTYCVRDNNFVVGDVVLVYEVKQNTHANSAYRVSKRLNSCSIGIIRSITPQGITLQLIANPDTHLSRIKSVEQAMTKSRYKTYDEVDKHTFHTSKRTFPWIDIGADVMTYNESMFFLRPFEEDGTEQWLTDGVNQQKVFLNTIETCYAVLKDRKIEFDETRFRQLFYGNKIPIYDMWEARHAQNVQAGLCK